MPSARASDIESGHHLFDSCSAGGVTQQQTSSGAIQVPTRASDPVTIVLTLPDAVAAKSRNFAGYALLGSRSPSQTSHLRLTPLSPLTL